MAAGSNKVVGILLSLFVVLNCFADIRSTGQLLPEEEVQALQTISSKLQNRFWSVSRSSCSGGGNLNATITSKIGSNVTCDCSFNSNTVCHVTHIQLKGLNLTGTLPEEFVILRFLQEL